MKVMVVPVGTNARSDVTWRDFVSEKRFYLFHPLITSGWLGLNSVMPKIDTPHELNGPVSHLMSDPVVGHMP
jgi:hypothetical protein